MLTRLGGAAVRLWGSTFALLGGLELREVTPRARKRGADLAARLCANRLLRYGKPQRLDGEQQMRATSGDKL
jgi:hypothetical protein